MSKPEHFNWTPEAEDELRAHWASGITAEAIAATMGRGLTKNSICGRVRRLKLPQRRPLPSGSQQLTEKKANAARIAALRPKSGRGDPKPQAIAAKRADKQAGRINPFDVEDNVDALDVTHLVGLLSLERGMCKWPVTGEGSATLFCGDATTHGPYCPTHSERAGAGYGRGARP